ncbi:hypothetical protein APUTEX25_003698, partial [Auxenochlorella protothecoides]
DSLAHSLDASQQAQLYASKELEECQSSLKTHKEQLAVADAVNLARGSDLQAKQRELEKALQQLEALHARNTDLEEQLAGSQSAHRAAEQAARSAEARASGVAHQAASAAGEAAEREREWQAQLSVSEGRRRQAELGLDAAVKDLASFLEETDTLRGELETAKAAAAAAEKVSDFGLLAQSELSRRMEEQQRVSAQAAAKQRQAATAEIASLASQLEVLRAECGAAIAKAAEQGSQVEWLESALKEAQIAAKDARAAWRSAEGALHSAVRSRTAAQGRRLALLEAWVHERGMRLHAQEDVALESQSLQQILDAVRELRQEGGWDSEFQEKLMGEWTKLEQAKAGTLRNRGYKLAQAVLSREDPMETFLKSVPDPPAPLEVIAPDVFEERYVRRRLRMLAASSQRRHRSRMGLWLLALLPQAPILLTPLPAITIYYTAYRFYSHYRALKGGQALQRRFLDLDAQQIARLRAQLLDMQAGEGGLEVKPGTWVSDLLQPKHMYLDLFQRLEETQRREALERQRVDNPDPSEPGSGQEKNMLIFTASKELTSILQPAKRLTHPLDDKAAVAAAEYLGAPNLLQGKSMYNAEKKGKKQVLIRPSSKVVIKFLQVMQKHGYIGEFEFVDNHRSGKIVVELNGRLNKCGVISPRYDFAAGDIEHWVGRLLPSRQFGFFVVTTSQGIFDHEEARRKKVGGKLLGFFY